MLKKILLISLVLSIAACTSKQGGSGNILDNQDKKFDQLQKDLLNQNADDALLNTFELIAGDENGVRLNDRVFFSDNSAVLTSMSQSILDSQVTWLKNNMNKKIFVEGHTDERGTREYNLALGDSRANAVKSYLVSSGIKNYRITTVSYGKERPLFLDSGSAAMAKNRRAVTIVRKN